MIFARISGRAFLNKDDDDDNENFAFQETGFCDRRLRRNKQRIA